MISCGNGHFLCQAVAPICASTYFYLFLSWRAVCSARKKSSNFRAIMSLPAILFKDLTSRQKKNGDNIYCFDQMVFDIRSLYQISQSEWDSQQYKFRLKGTVRNFNHYPPPPPGNRASRPVSLNIKGTISRKPKTNFLTSMFNDETALYWISPLTLHLGFQ